MESQQQKWVNLSYLSVAGLLGYLIFSAGMYAGGAYDLEARVHNFEWIVRGAALLVAAVLFLGLYSNDRVNQFMNEVLVELGRVSWPTQRETANSTFVVIAMVLISGVILGFLDYFWTVLLKMVL